MICAPTPSPFGGGASLPERGYVNGMLCPCDCHSFPAVHVTACCFPKPILGHEELERMQRSKRLTISELTLDDQGRVTGKVSTVVAGVAPSTICTADATAMGARLGQSGQVFVNGVGWTDPPVEHVNAANVINRMGQPIVTTLPIGLSACFVAKVADVIHLLEFATITCPSVGDAEQARRLLDELAKELKA